MTKHRITHRLVAKGNWISQTALHCGGDPNGSTVDMALLRDEHGQFLIPAASIAGAARHHLARLLSESYEAWRTPVNDDRPKEGD